MQFEIERIERTDTSGTVEELRFASGVNLIVAPPNSGKTTWLHMFNHLLGSEAAPSQIVADEVARRCAEVAAHIKVNGETVFLRRRWNEYGMMGKVLWNGTALNLVDFQKRLLTTLGLPVLGYPRADAVSQPVWPTLSFRMLFRHLYRQQRFWFDIVAKQPEAESRACLLLLFGLAPQVFTDSYRRYFQIATQSDALRARLYGQELAMSTLARVVTPEHDASEPRSLQAWLRYIEEQLAEVDGSTSTSIEEELRLRWQAQLLGRWRDCATEALRDLAALSDLEKAAKPLFAEIELARDTVQVAEAAEELTEGMTEYLQALNRYRPGTWLHHDPHVTFRRNRVVFDVGAKRWNQALGGTDALYYQLSYHYALMRSSSLKNRSIPALTMLDLPADFAGESVASHENFIVQPFIELADRLGPEPPQIIFAGASFRGLKGCHRLELDTRYLA